MFLLSSSITCCIYYHFFFFFRVWTVTCIAMSRLTGIIIIVVVDNEERVDATSTDNTHRCRRTVGILHRCPSSYVLYLSAHHLDSNPCR